MQISWSVAALQEMKIGAMAGRNGLECPMAKSACGVDACRSTNTVILYCSIEAFKSFWLCSQIILPNFR